MNNTKWIYKNESNYNFDSDINLDSDILSILQSRGITETEDILKFLNPQIENIHSPFLLKDVDKAVDKIIELMNSNKEIWIYGDYDVDGMTSTSLLMEAFKNLKYENIHYYIPLRDEGYGLNKEAINEIKKQGADIIITVDCGITSFEEIDFSNSIGLPVIITDHHDLHGKLPNAFSVINPKREDNEFPFKYLAGVGTAFLLVMALYDKLGKKEDAYKFIDIVAIGTVADIVPLIEENRIFTKFGLEKLLTSDNLGLNVLTSMLFKDKSEYSTYDIGFIIAPIFNAAGRLKDAKMVVQLLTTENKREAQTIASELISKNEERKQLQSEILENVENNFKNANLEEDYVLVDYGANYHHGVIGIVASKIVDTYHRPTIILELKEDEGIAVASCRSIEGFNLMEALQTMPELFIKFGGHAGAAGFSIDIKDIELFKKKINQYAKKVLTTDDFIKTIKIDQTLPIHKVSYEFMQILDKLKPFGFGNTSPIFETKNVALENIKFIGKDKSHLMFDIKKENFIIKNSVWFSSSDNYKELNKSLYFDIVYKLKVEEYQNRYYTKIYVEDIENSEDPLDIYNHLYSMYNTKLPLKSIFYSKKEINSNKILMRFDYEQITLLQGKSVIGQLEFNVSNLLKKLNQYYNWNFKLSIISSVEKDNLFINNVVIERDYFFKTYEINDKRIFQAIKEFLIEGFDYTSFEKNVLSKLFKSNENAFVILKEDKYYDNLFLTCGLYFYTKQNTKSQIITDDINLFENFSFIKNYFDVNSEYKKDYPFTINLTDQMFEITEQHIQLTNDENTKNCIVDNGFVPDNVKILDETPNNTENFFFKYLSNDQKLNLLHKVSNNENIFSDESIKEYF